MDNKKEPLLIVRDIAVHFRNKGKINKAVEGASFDVYKGETLALVGESGSGKTTIGKAIAGVQPLKDGTIYMDYSILRGKAPNLYKLNIAITESFGMLKVNNIALNDLLNKYFMFLKVNYFRLFENKIYKHNVFELRDDVKPLNITTKILRNINIQLTAIRKKYESILVPLKNILDIEKRLFRFLDGINQYINEIDIDLEKLLLEKLAIQIKAIEKVILFAGEIFEEFLDAFEKLEVLKQDFSTDNFGIFIKQNLNLFNTLVPKHRDLMNDIEKINNSHFKYIVLFVPQVKCKHFVSKINKKFYVPLKELIKIFNGNSFDDVTKITFDRIIQISNVKPTIYNDLLNSLEENASENVNLDLLPKEIQEELINIKDKELLIKRIYDYKFLATYKYLRTENELNFYFKIVNKSNDLSVQEINELMVIINQTNKKMIFDICKASTFTKSPNFQKNKQNKKMVQMIFQDPSSSLNDRISVEEIVGEGISNFKEIYKNDEVRQLYLDYYNANLVGTSKELSLSEVKDNDVKHFLILSIIKAVGLLPEHLSRYSHEFSGGQRQRIGVARALIMKPKFIIADEPISALDVSIRSQVLNLLQNFQNLDNLTYLFVAHDLSVVRFIADRIAVIYRGKLVELAPSEELFQNPLHPYTKALLSAIPIPNPHYEKQKKHFIYNPEKEHYDYVYNVPNFVEIKPDHFILVNNRELKKLKKNLIKEE